MRVHQRQQRRKRQEAGAAPLHPPGPVAPQVDRWSSGGRPAPSSSSRLIGCQLAGQLGAVMTFNSDLWCDLLFKRLY